MICGISYKLIGALDAVVFAFLHFQFLMVEERGAPLPTSYALNKVSKRELD